MEFEFKDLEKLGDDKKMGYFEHKMKTMLAISVLEDKTKTPTERYMLENLKLDLLDKEISLMFDRMTDETLDKIADVYEKARVELEKIVAEAEPKE